MVPQGERMRQHREHMRALMKTREETRQMIFQALIDEIKASLAARDEERREWAEAYKKQPGFLPPSGQEVARFVRNLQERRREVQRCAAGAAVCLLTSY